MCQCLLSRQVFKNQLLRWHTFAWHVLVARLHFVAAAAIYRAIRSVSSRSRVVAKPGSLSGAASVASHAALRPRSPFAPVAISVFSVTASWSEKSVKTVALPWVDTVAVDAIPIGNAL